MKKILVALLVLALGIPALADVAVTWTDLGGGHLQIKVAPTAGAAVRGVALKLTRTAGDAAIGATTDAAVTQFNTNIDYAFSHSATYDVGQGHPLATADQAGELADFPASTFSLCSGYLDASRAGVVVDSFFDVYYTLTTDSTITIELDPIRGGIVGDDLGAVTVQSPATLVGAVNYDLAMSAGANGTLDADNSGSYASGTVVNIDATPNTYYKFAAWTGDTANITNPASAHTTITMNADATIQATFVKKTCFEMLSAADQAEYNKYIAAGKTAADMVSWCWRFQCRGDADNAAYLPTTLKWQVYQADLNILIAQWKTTYATATNVAANFDHAAYLPTTLKWTVYQSDLNILIDNWKKTPTTLVECPSYLP
jgi:hypothetical protein